MKTTKGVTVYQCEYCKKKLFREHAMKHHEQSCFHNPENLRPCFECSNLIKKDITLHFDTFDGEGTRVVQSFFCEAKNVCLHTPKNEIKGNAFDLGYDENLAMPKECSQFVDKYNLPF